ncbi:helix-turn-helix domain-containing protein [Streptomyces sp. NBRC 110465]|uniref:helix-turn-helix domain-containing protein n=1 Tax=Streptomyces sp. NBRC 110465 TaxID=1897621 RepID=UPI0009345FF4|nr:helix-turn-helix transcriptional regulator [Streptomyces sp. NBRC 110465]
MQIGRVLSALRERAALTQAEVAGRAGVSIGTVNRYEGWQDRTRLRVPTVRAIADVCGATESERDGLVRLATSHEDGWWLEHPALPDILNPLMSFEAYAAYEHVWANQLVPGLLQTEGYAFALHQVADPRADASSIKAKVTARMNRQGILSDSGLHLWVVMKQSVLTDGIGGAKVMAEQISHLIEVSSQPNIDLQVLPRGRGHVANSGGHFVLLGRDDGADPMASMAVVYLELHRRGLYLDAPGDVSEYKIMFDYLRSAAADPETSRDLLESARQEYTR